MYIGKNNNMIELKTDTRLQQYINTAIDIDDGLGTLISQAWVMERVPEQLQEQVWQAVEEARIDRE